MERMRRLFVAVLLALSVPAWSQPPHARGRVLVQFREDADLLARVRALDGVRSQGLKRLGHLRFFSVALPPDQDEQEAVTLLLQDAAVEVAQLDVAHYITLVPNDPSYANQWQLPSLNCPAAWDVTTGSASVTIAILDTGCDPTHPDLAANYVVGQNFVNGTTDTHDWNGHGTFVAGCADAIGNNGIGVAGVSWNSKIMPCVVADSTGYAYDSNITTGMQWAADHGAKVENLSFEGIPGDSVIVSAAQYVYQKGGIVVCAAGNAGTLDSAPASPYLVVASGLNQNLTLASFSEYGPSTTVAAPAVSVYSTTNGGGYGGGSGTSFASPLVCGVFALEWAANPNLTPSQAVQVLEQTALDLGTAGWDQYFGYGEANAGAAVVLAQSVPAPPPDTIPPTCAIVSPPNGSTVPSKPNLGVTCSATDNVGVVSVTLTVDGSQPKTDTAAPWTFNVNTKKWATGTHTLTATARDAAGNVSAPSTISVVKQ